MQFLVDGGLSRMAKLSSYQKSYWPLTLPPLLWSKFLRLCDERGADPNLELEKALAYWMQAGGDPVRTCTRCHAPLKLGRQGSPMECKTCEPYGYRVNVKLFGWCQADAKKAANAKGGGFRDAAQGALVLWLESGGDEGRAWAQRYDLQGVER